jgi:uncharacterized protein YcbX
LRPARCAARTLRPPDEARRITTIDFEPTPQLARIRVFPFKSLDGVDVLRSLVLPSGALWRDREIAFFDERGGFVNGKRNEKVHALRVRYDERLTQAHFTSTLLDDRFSYAFADTLTDLELWLERHFEQRILGRRNDAAGFPDDTNAPGPTIVSTATLEAVAGWVPGVDVPAIRDRLRSNLEVSGVPAFWEDRLYANAGDAVAFRVGDVAFAGTNPCARCVVPSRDARSGRPTPGFAKLVAERRAATLPAWANRARFDHYYRLAGNTRCAPAQGGKSIAVGDELTLCDVSIVQREA